VRLTTSLPGATYVHRVMRDEVAGIAPVRTEVTRVRWRLPVVPPDVARRRRAFFASVALLLLVSSAWSILTAARVASPGGKIATQDVDAHQVQLGCSLDVGSQTITLPLKLAMALTDIAGRDQNAAGSLRQTASRVAAAWPAQASRSGAIAASLRGCVPDALACASTLPHAPREPIQADGLTARANAMWTAIKTVFGPLPAGGFMPGGVQTGHVPGSAHYEGRAIDFFYRPIGAKTIRHGWVLAQWLEAHAQQLQIATVIFDARIWTPASWEHRLWSTYTYPDGPTNNVTLLHFDHVHVDVQRGT
jgi:hypothetical protein